MSELNLDLHFWRAVTATHPLRIGPLVAVAIFQPSSASAGKEASICGVQALCQVLYKCYLIKCLQPACERAPLPFLVTAAEVRLRG